MKEINNYILDIVSKKYSINIENINSWLSYPPKAELGDYALSCFHLASALKRNPAEIAIELKDELNKNSNIFKNASNMGGYVNFFVSDKVFLDELSDLNIEEKNKNNETIIVDYIGANVGKPLHIGHLCTPSIGQSIINIYRFLGYNVIGDNHWGDWGGIFGKLITAYKLFGNKEDLEKEPIEYLLKLYIDITAKSEENEVIAQRCRDEFKKLSLGDKENIELWKEFVSYSINAVDKINKMINVKSDYNIGESFYEGLDLPKLEDNPLLKYSMKDIIDELLKEGIATKNEDGSVGVVFGEDTKLSSCVLQKKDGTSLYFTSDLAAIKYRLTNGWNPSKIIYCTDTRQQLHFKQLFYITKNIWSNLSKNTELVHAYNGYIKLKEGAMSTRKGIIIRFQDLIDEGFKRTKNELEKRGKTLSPENIQAITIGAIKYSYLSQDREKDVVFDWDKALNFEGNSGPYIQYAYVRAKKIINPSLSSGAERSEVEGSLELIKNEGKNINFSVYDKSLIKKLLEFDTKIEETAKKYKPHILATYCYELAQEFNSFYVHTSKILEEKDENLKNFRLSLVARFSEIIMKGFELLAIKMPEEM